MLCDPPQKKVKLDKNPNNDNKRKEPEWFTAAQKAEKMKKQGHK